MAKFKVLQRYRDLDLGKTLEADDEVEMTIKRADEVQEKLKDKGDFLERLDKPEKKEEKDKGE